MSVPQKLRCQIGRIIDHGNNVYTIDLKPERLIPRFSPGQFLHLAIDNYDPSAFWPDSRVFSIASSPLARDDLRISYSVKGRFTARMERELHEGKWVWVKLPYGEFLVNNSTDVVLFAGGTGITAFTAYLGALNAGFRNKVYLVYGARNPDLLLYRGLIEERSKEANCLFRFYFAEERTEHYGRQLNSPGCEEFVGRVSVGEVWSKIGNSQGATFYISGPAAMIEAVSLDLLNRGIKQEAIRTDAWE